MNLKVLTTRLNQIKLTMIWVGKQLKYLLCLLKVFLEKYEYLNGEDLGRRPSVLEKTKFEYSPLGMTLSKSFKKCIVKNVANKESNFNYDGEHKFYIFYKQHDEFEEMSLDFKHKKMKEFERLLNNFKNLIPTKEDTQLKKERIMKNVDKLYEKFTILRKTIMTMIMT